MSDGKSPHVRVKVETIAVRVGEVLTVMATGPDSNIIQIEIRSVGFPGANVGHVEVFCDEEISFSNFDNYKPMDQAIRGRFGLVSLMPPVPASKDDGDGTA